MTRVRSMLLAGAGAGLVLMLTPVGLIEMLVASSGFSEAVPAAAPPLALKARLIMALFVAVMAAAAMGFLGRSRDEAADTNEETRGDEAAQGAEKMGFAFSRLTALARGRVASPIDDMAPSLRRADAHPDAPARAPIFASRDFDGLDIFPRPDTIARRGIAAGNDTGPAATPAPSAPAFVAPFPDALAMPDAPVALSDNLLPEPAFLRPAFAPPAPEPVVDAEPVAEAEPAIEVASQPRPMSRAAEPLAPTQGLSVRELTERLERGLAMRSRTPATAPASAGTGVIADMEVAAPVPVRAHVAEDTDAALRAALGALRSMAARSR